MTEMCITVATHNFVVTRINPRVRPAINAFAKTLIQYGLVKGRGRSFQEKPVKVYAASTHARDEYRFHINHFEAFKKVLQQHQIHDGMVEWRKKDVPVGAPIYLEMQPHLTDREHQIATIDYITKEEGAISRLVEAQTGTGKAQTLDSKIKIPGGWTTMGEIKVGDTITAWDGSPTKVVGVFPQGEEIVYRVHFVDGRWTDAGAEHLWRVYYINAPVDRRWRVVNTLEVMRLITMPNPRVYVQLIEPEDCVDLDLPIPPYTLGAILGDGCLTGNGINITKDDDELFYNINKELPDELQIIHRQEITWAISSKINQGGAGGGNSYLNALRKMELQGKLSYEKFVPEIYLHGSKTQRLALLQGLLDTDGTVGKGGTISFASSSIRLSQAVQYLVRSLGGVASISKKTPHYTYKEERLEGREAYIVNIRHTKPSELFRLTRKKSRTNDDNQYSSDLKLRVTGVKMMDVKETQCISVDHPDHLYVTDEFIVTHNTYMAMRGMQEYNQRTVVIIKPGYIEQWIRDFKQNTLINPKRIVTVAGSKELKSLLFLASDGELPYDIVIISNATYRNYLAEYELHGKYMLDMGYMCTPENLFEFLKAGFRVIDEVHQDFHLNFKCDLYTNIARSLSLSATFRSDNHFVNQMYEAAYPTRTRCKGADYIKYVHAYSMQYSFRMPEKIRTLGATGMYSHHEFEKCILKSAQMLENYFKLVHSSMMFTYDVDYKRGNKCLVYFASIEMCTRFKDWIGEAYPYLKVARYVEDDSYQDLIEADIGVSTVGSAGTGLDIPELTTVILTTAINSTQGNLQGFGRIRNLKDGRKMYFVYFVGSDFPKHIEYHERKVELLRTRAWRYEERFYSSLI